MSHLVAATVLRVRALPAFLLAATLIGGCAAPRDATAPRTSQPNYLVIVADDLGPLDLGFLGSEIRTPNLDELARDGLVLSQFLVSPACSPTRAMLLSGMDAHPAGLGTMDGEAKDGQLGAPGYAGVLSENVETIATLLSRAGYHTSMAGKWHLGREEHLRPHRRGFERSFGVAGGGATHFADALALLPPEKHAQYYLDGEPVDLPDDFFTTEAYTDRLIEFIGEAADQGRPFFSFAAYTAPHWPLQAPDEWIDRYAGAYDDGYDALRERRFQAALDSGVVPESASAPPRNPFASAWDDLTPDEHAIAARTMEVYAAMVENLDHHIGRLVGSLRERGVLDDTVILFFSDNGPEGNPVGQLEGIGEWVSERFDNRLENIGRLDSYTWTGPGWAQASAAPFRLFKSFPTEGGVRVPAIVHGPVARRGRSDAVVSVRDIAPTLLDLAGAPVPAAMSGRSMRAFLDGEADSVRSDDDTIGYELFGRRAVRQGRWKAAWIWPPYGPGAWELFDLERDPGEQHDLSVEAPERLAALITAWDAYVAENSVVLPDSDAGYAIEAGTPDR